MSTNLISLTTVIAASPEQVSCELANETVILNLKNGEYYGLNEVGARIWQEIQTPRSIESLRDSLLAGYPDVDVETCTQDVLELVEQFLEAELVHVSRDEGSDPSASAAGR